MGSHSKKRKKDRKRSKSRSSSRSRSRSPSHRSSKHKKHHRRSRSRSRSRSREKHSHSRRASRSRSRERERSRDRDRDRTSKRRRSRSRSLTRRSRSRSTERRRRRSRSRSAEKKSKRSRSQERHKSPERLSGKSSRSESQESATVKKEDAADTDLNLTPAEAIRKKMRKALEAAASADAKLREQGLLSSVKQEAVTHTDVVEREQVLQGLESDSFVPTSFVSSRDKVQPTYLTREQSHDNAIFGGAELPSAAVNGTQTYSYGIPITYKKRGQLASRYLSESVEEKEKRWIEKLQAMRRQKMQANPEYFKKLLNIHAGSPTRD